MRGSLTKRPEIRDAARGSPSPSIEFEESARMPALRCCWELKLLDSLLRFQEARGVRRLLLHGSCRSQRAARKPRASFRERSPTIARTRPIAGVAGRRQVAQRDLSDRHRRARPLPFPQRAAGHVLALVLVRGLLPVLDRRRRAQRLAADRQRAALEHAQDDRVHARALVGQRLSARHDDRHLHRDRLADRDGARARPSTPTRTICCAASQASRSTRPEPFRFAAALRSRRRTSSRASTTRRRRPICRTRCRTSPTSTCSTAWAACSSFPAAAMQRTATPAPGLVLFTAKHGTYPSYCTSTPKRCSFPTCISSGLEWGWADPSQRLSNYAGFIGIRRAFQYGIPGTAANTLGTLGTNAATLGSTIDPNLVYYSPSVSEVERLRRQPDLPLRAATRASGCSSSSRIRRSRRRSTTAAFNSCRTSRAARRRGSARPIR